MPKRILIIGLLFFISGLWGVWDVLSSLSTHHIKINLGAFSLPIGLGLLSGKTSSRRWAKFWIILGYASCLLLGTITLLMHHAIRINWFGRKIQGTEGVPYILSLAITLASLLFLTHRLLYSPKAEAFFLKYKS